MARVSSSEVQEIVSNPNSVTLTAFITAANILVTKVLGDSGLDADHLKEIERWLAAHFFCVRDPRAAAKGVSNSSVTFQGKTDLGLKHTSYGQQVLILDTTGKLAELGKQRAQFAVVSHNELPEDSDL